MTELTVRPAEQVVTTTALDPTGGRLVAWAQAASAANQLARALSTTTFVPQAMREVGNATAAILMGDELGLSPLAALRSIYVVHGTPALYARSMVALALSQGHQVWTEESTDQRVTVAGQRKGSDHVERATWTPARARKAGYTTNKKYESNPEEMLWAKAAAEVARKVAADVLAGIPESVEELELEQTPTVTVTRGAVTTTAKRRTPAPQPAEPEFTESTEPAEPTPDGEAPDVPEPLSAKTRGQMFAELTRHGITDPNQQRIGMTKILGRTVTSRSSLTEDEARAVILDLTARPVTAPAAVEEPPLWAEPTDGAE